MPIFGHYRWILLSNFQFIFPQKLSLDARNTPSVQNVLEMLVANKKNKNNFIFFETSKTKQFKKVCQPGNVFLSPPPFPQIKKIPKKTETCF